MPKEAYNQLVSEVLALSYAEQLQLMALIVQQMQQEKIVFSEKNMITEKLNEVYSKIPVAEQTVACGAALEVVRETTKNDTW